MKRLALLLGIMAVALIGWTTNVSVEMPVERVEVIGPIIKSQGFGRMVAYWLDPDEDRIAEYIEVRLYNKKVGHSLPGAVILDTNADGRVDLVFAHKPWVEDNDETELWGERATLTLAHSSIAGALIMTVDPFNYNYNFEE